MTEPTAATGPTFEDPAFEDPAFEDPAFEAPGLEELIRANLPVVYHLAGRSAGVVDRDELVAEGMSGLWRAATSYNPDHPSGARFGTYAWAVIRGRMLKAIAAEHNRRQREEELTEQASTYRQAEEWGDPQHLTEQLEERNAVHRAVARLAEADRQIIYAVYYEEKTQSQLARERGVSRNRINAQLKKALQRTAVELAVVTARNHPTRTVPNEPRRKHPSAEKKSHPKEQTT